MVKADMVRFWCAISAVSIAWRDAKIRTYKLLPVKRRGRPPKEKRR